LAIEVIGNHAVDKQCITDVLLCGNITLIKKPGWFFVKIDAKKGINILRIA
jgi:hypothetical protein